MACTDTIVVNGTGFTCEKPNPRHASSGEYHVCSIEHFSDDDGEDITLVVMWAREFDAIEEPSDNEEEGDDG